MAGRRTVLVTLITSTLLLAATATASAASAGTIALWGMNEARGARTMVDSGGRGLSGSIGSEVHTATTVGNGTGYRFDRLEPDTPPARPGHVVTVRDNSALDPGNRDYLVTVRLRTSNHFGNIIQKGQATASGGNFKLQIPSGRVECLFRGSRGSRMVVARHPINDGAWHTVQCERNSTGLVLRIDGAVESRVTGWTGTIANSWPVSIGGKTNCDQRSVGCDYYAGDIDWIQLDAR